MNSEETRELLNMVELGVEGEKFLATNLGGALISRMQQDHDAAMTALLQADALFIGTTGIQTLQNKAKLPLLILAYLNDIVEEGRQAEQIMNDKE